MQVLIAKKLKLEEIIIIHSDYEFSFEPEAQQAVDKLREDKLQEAEKKGQKIRDAMSYYLKSYEYDEHKLTLELGTVRFRNTSMQKHLPDNLGAISEKSSPKGMYISGFVKTSDGYYVFGKRNSKNITSGTSGKITTFGGALQPGETSIITAYDLILHMAKELEEECGISKAYVDNGVFLGMVASKAGNRGILCHIHLTISKDDVLQKFQEGNDGEMEEVISIHESELVEFLDAQTLDEKNDHTNFWLYKEILKQTELI